jgi:hypothetical protein
MQGFVMIARLQPWARICCASLLALAAGSCISDGAIKERTNTDNWFQAPNNEVDILWVVDDSCSMTEEQATLTNGFVSFVAEMEDSGTEFQIGVISTTFDYTDSDRGKLIGEPAYLTNDDDYETLFGERATVGIDGSDKEKGLEAAAYALSFGMTVDGHNAGFLRSDAQLLIIFVSDEEDCSDDGRLEGQPPAACYTERDKLVPVPQYVKDFRKLKGDDAEMVTVGAIVGVNEDRCDIGHVGGRYIEAVSLTGGLVGDICEGDWSAMLSELGLNATGIKMSFQLSEAAKPESIEVFVDEELVPEDASNGWTYDAETWYITFHGPAVPARGSEIYATYTVQSGADAPS